MTDNKSVMNVKILKEAGFEEAMLAIAMNKKKYDRDMYPVSKKLAFAGGGHDKFLEMISVWLDYTTSRSIHQQIDTYRVGVTKSSESTHHMLIEDVLETCIDRKQITQELAELGFKINTERCLDGLVPINNTALVIAKIKSFLDGISDWNAILNEIRIVFSEYALKYLYTTKELTNILLNDIQHVFLNNFHIDYEKYYSMFEGGKEAITRDMVDRMVYLAMTLEEDRYGKLHQLKRMLPEGFLQRRIMACNYQVLRTMLKQRFQDPFEAWQEFCRQVILQVEHPEYFEDILENNHTSKEELAQNKCNGRDYGIKK